MLPRGGPSPLVDARPFVCAVPAWRVRAGASAVLVVRELPIVTSRGGGGGTNPYRTSDAWQEKGCGREPTEGGGGSGVKRGPSPFHDFWTTPNRIFKLFSDFKIMVFNDGMTIFSNPKLNIEF